MPTKGSHQARKSCANQFLRVFPPYAKYAIFLACGLEVLYHAFAMAISKSLFLHLEISRSETASIMTSVA